MEKDFIKILRELRKIEPDAEYGKHSRFLILSSAVKKDEINPVRNLGGVFEFSRRLFLNGNPRRKRQGIISNGIKLTAAYKIYHYFYIHYLILSELAVAVAIFVSAVYLIVSYLPGNKNDLVAEANEINASIQIELNGIKYYLENQPQISSSSANDISARLEKAAQELEAARDLSTDSEKLKEVLEKIKISQDALIEISGLLGE